MIRETINSCIDALQKDGVNSKKTVRDQLIQLKEEITRKATLDELQAGDMVEFRGKKYEVFVDTFPFEQKHLAFDGGCFGPIHLDRDHPEISFYRKDIRKIYKQYPDGILVAFEVLHGV
jgi:hypothetical protein